MKKIQIYLIIFFTQFLFLEKVNSAEIDIYKKIDLFGEVLEKINKEMTTNNNNFLIMIISLIFLWELALPIFFQVHKIFFSQD